MWWWWAGWVAVVVFLLLLPLSYGWGRRGWGPPYPSYYRRRRAVAVRPESGDVDPANPGVPPVRDRSPAGAPGVQWLADLFWLAVLATAAWAVYLWVS